LRSLRHFPVEWSFRWNFFRRLACIGGSPGLGWIPKPPTGFWGEYVEKKRAGKTGRRPVADVLIEAFAQRFEGLIARNLKDFASVRCIAPWASDDRLARILDQRIGFVETAGAFS
jgi:hypothetical protein